MEQLFGILPLAEYVQVECLLELLVTLLDQLVIEVILVEGGNEGELEVLFEHLEERCLGLADGVAEELHFDKALVDLHVVEVSA